MKLVPLTNSDRFAAVDDSDFETVSTLKWFLAGDHAYSTTREFRNRAMSMHHFLAGFPPTGLETDHRDRNGLNNQRHNLRFVTPSINTHNRKSWRSGLPGVYFDNRPSSPYKHPWRAQIRINRVKFCLGHFPTEIDAHAVYLAAKVKALAGALTP